MSPSRTIRPLLLAVATTALLPAFLGAASLNPTVKVLPRASATPPSDCDAGLAPAAVSTRLAIAEIPEPAAASTMEPPPRATLRSLLRETQAAAQSGDRDAFRAHLADLGTMVAGYPRGGERDDAEQTLGVYKDLDRLWTYSADSPTGAFFDAGTDGGALLKTLTKYPQYGRFIARQTVNAGGVTLYPTAESRQFLTREAATRLGSVSPAPALAPRTGSRSLTHTATPAPSAPRERRREDEPVTKAATQHRSQGSHRKSPTATSSASSSEAPAPVVKAHGKHPAAADAPSSTKTAVKSPAASKTGERTSVARQPAAKPATREAVAKAPPVREPVVTPVPAASAPSSAASGASPSASAGTLSTALRTDTAPHTPAPRVADPGTATGNTTTNTINTTTNAPTPTNATVNATTNTIAPGGTGTTGTNVTASATDTTVSTATSTATASTDTTVTTAATDTTVKGVTPAPAGRNFIIPIILILIGLGVLILLFRASS